MFNIIAQWSAERLGVLLRDLDDDRLDLRVRLEAVLAELAPVARHLVAAERHACVERVVAVDPTSTST